MRLQSCIGIPGGWSIGTVESICQRVTSGGTPSRRRPDFYAEGSLPWVKTKELDDGWVMSTEERITYDASKLSSAKLLPANTILMAMYGATVGKLGLLSTPMTCNQACCALIVDESKAAFRYVFYQLLANRSQIRKLATGAAQQNISGELIRKLELPLPPLPTQAAIAEVLGALDDKIDLNRRTIDITHELCLALFQKTSEKAVRRTRLDDLLELNPRRTVVFGTPASYIDMKALPINSALVRDIASRPARPGSRFARGDTLLARITPCLENGKTAFVDSVDIGWGSTEFIVMKPFPPLFDEYAYLLARTPNFRSHAIASMSGSSGRQRVPTDAVAAYQAPVFEDDAGKALGAQIKPMFEMMGALENENRALARLRDALLPELISGRMTVKEAAAAV